MEHEEEAQAWEGRGRAADVVNEGALELKLRELCSSPLHADEASWLETLAITSAEPLSLDDHEDDLKRELAFYNQALDAVKVAQERFARLGVPHVRPDDYFAEMIKSDNHMTKVKKKMVHQQQEIVQQEERRKQKANKKFGKQVQRETLVARAQQKKRNIAEVTQLRKSRKMKGGNDEFDINIANDSMEKGGGTKPGSKREYHDKKFGKQRHDKKNSAESSGDMRDFNRGGKTFGKGGKGSTAKGGRGKGGRGAGGGKGTSGKGGGGKGGRGAGGPGKTIQKKRPGKDARKARK